MEESVDGARAATDGAAPVATAERLEDLVSAAEVLLGAACLEGVQVLHGEIARGLCLSSPVPPAYASRSEALRAQRALLAEWRARNHEPRGALAVPLGYWRRRPAWAVRVTVVAVVLLLTARYALVVSDDGNWERQHPEGNWISRFYPDAQFQGFPLVRYDIGVNSDFSSGAPAKDMAKDGFSARWDTCLEVKHDVQLNLELEADDQATLFVDGAPSATVGPAPGKAATTLALQPGLFHVKVEFVELTGMAMVRLNGLVLEGTESYRFRRPRFGARSPDGTLEDTLRCDPSG